MVASRFEASDVLGIHGEVILSNEQRVQILVGDDSEVGVRVIRGRDSVFLYFVFVPPYVRDTMLELDTNGIFEEVLVFLCEAIYEHDEYFK